MRIGKKDNPIFEMYDDCFTFLVMLIAILLATTIGGYIDSKNNRDNNVQQQGLVKNPPD